MANLSSTGLQSEVARLRQLLRLIRACNRAIIRAENESNLLQTICQLMLDQGGYRFAWVGYLEADSIQTVKPVVYAGASEDLKAIPVEEYSIDQVLRSNKSYLVQGLRLIPYLQFANQSDCQAVLILPLVDHNAVFGMLSLYAETPDCFPTEAVQLLNELATDLSYVIAKLRADEVRTQTEQALQERYQQHDNLVNRVPVGVYKFRMSPDETMQFIYVSPFWGEMNRLDPAAVIADPSLAFGLIHPDEIDAFVQLNQQARSELKQFVWEGRMLIEGKVTWRHIESTPSQQANGDIIWNGIQYDITELVEAKQAQERALAEAVAARMEATNANNLLSTVFNRVSDSIVALDNNWCYTYINDNAATLMGRSAAELIGKCVWTEFPDGVGKPFYRAYHQAVEQQRVISLEEYYEPWGRWFENRIYPDAQGLTVYFTETTERQVAALEIAASEYRYASLAAAVPVGIFRTDVTGNCIYVNDRWSQIAGLSPEAAMGLGWINGLHPADRELIQTEWYLAAQENRLFQLEYRFQRPDGQVSWVYGQALAELNEQGEVSGYVGTITDISDRKAAEAQRLQAEQIRRELNLLEDIFDIVMAGYWEWDLPRERHYMSYGWKRMLGYEDEALPPRPETWKALIFPEDLPVVMYNFEQHVQSQGQIPYYNEVRYRHKDGSTVWMICSGRVIEWDNGGNPLRMIGCHINITDRKLIEAELQRLNQDLRRSNQDLEQFAYITSHDLQEPLRAIIAYTQHLSQNYDEVLSDPMAQEALGFIIDGGQRMRQLIQDLLEYSRVGSQPLQIVTTDVNVVLAEALQNLAPTIEEAQAVITFDPLPSLPVDPTQLRQLFQNLLSNAIKFRREVPLAIHITTRPGSEGLVTDYQFAISDNGIGIKPQYLTQIFEIFRRLHTRSQFPGTGIGLAISKKIIDRHGGEIWATSEWGQGTTVCFTLPAKVNQKSLP
jgi:PAS domain S-box-containing protein